MLSRYDLYQLCAQAPDLTARFLHAVHGRNPTILRDDFAGPAAIARAWSQRVPGGRAVAVDRDPRALAHAGSHARVTPIVGDVVRCRRKADIVAAFNFAVCELQERRTLVRYLKAVRASLRLRGIFACDLYGGDEAYAPRAYTRRLRGPNGERITYTWRQVEADPATAMVRNTMSFRVQPRRRATRATDRGSARSVASVTAALASKPYELRDAFVYHWRLWTFPELRDAMLEAGFRAVELHDCLGDAVDSDGRLYTRPLSADDRLDDNFVVYLVARR